MSIGNSEWLTSRLGVCYIVEGSFLIQESEARYMSMIIMVAQVLVGQRASRPLGSWFFGSVLTSFNLSYPLHKTSRAWARQQAHDSQTPVCLRRYLRLPGDGFNALPCFSQTIHHFNITSNGCCHLYGECWFPPSGKSGSLGRETRFE